MSDKTILRVYIARKLRTPSFIDYIANCRKMCETAREVQEAGFAIYVPCWDLLQVFLVNSIDFDDLFGNSIDWLVLCDAVLVEGDDWSSSKGTVEEIRIAKKHNIPVFFSLKDMQKHFEEKK